MASDVKAALVSIKELIKSGSFQDGLLQCKELLRTNPESFESNVFAGKCACELHLFEEAERYYNCAHEHKRAALQPFHGLVQLYRRTGAHDKHAQALRHVLATGKDEASKYATRVELVKALIHSNQPMEASEVLIAIEHALHLLNEDDLELPEEVSILKADCQIALDETEYNNRIQITLEDAHSLSAKNSSRAHQDDDLLIQEVAATWAEELLSRTDDVVDKMAQAASTAPHPRFTKYQIEILKRVMATIHGAPAGSTERHERRVAAVQLCCDIVSRGGCTSVTPYELALRLLEVEEEVSAHASCGVGGASFTLPAGIAKGVGGLGGASAAGVSMPRSTSALNAVAAAAAAAVAATATASTSVSTPPDTQKSSLTATTPLEVGRPSLAPVATAPPLVPFASGNSHTMPSSATASAPKSNLDLLLSGLPLASSAPTLVDGETSLTPSGTLPQTPARRSSSGVTGRSAPSASAGAVPSARKSGPSFGPTKIDLGDIETPSSSERSEADVDESKLVAGGDGMLTKALQAEDVEEGGAGEAGKVASGVANGSSALPISRMLANAPRGSMVRFASRQTSDFAYEEVIPVVGSYELRALSRSTLAPPSAAVCTATGAANAAGAVATTGHIGCVTADVSVAEVHPCGGHGESPQRADGQSSIGFGGATASGLHRRNSYASSDAFGGLTSIGSVAGSEELAPPRVALPPLSALPRISREESSSMAHATFSPSHADNAASGTFARNTGDVGVGHGGSVAPGCSPSRGFSITHAPSITSRMSGSVHGSFFAGGRYVPPPDEEVAPVTQLGLLEDMERFAARLVHLAPNSDIGHAHLAMALQRRAAELEHTAPQLQRPRVIAALRGPLERGVPTAAGWLCLAGLYRKDGNASEALWAARMGLQYISGKARARGERMTQAGLALRLEAAQALLALERLDEAVDAFSLLKKWTSEGEITFPYVAGIMPTSVRQQAARGLAQVDVLKGNRCAAKRQYEKLLGKALRGYGPSEHWAHAEYAWLLFEDGLRDAALHHLQAAIDVSGLGDSSVDPAEVASYHFKLGRVLWETKAKGEEGSKDAANAYEAFLHAASIDGPAQGPAFAYLGHHFRAQGEEMKARKCYRRALEIDATQASAGLALCELLHDSNSEDIVKGICEEMLEQEPRAAWARLRLGLHHLCLNRPRDAIADLQASLGMEPNSAEAWEALGAAYESVGRLQAALKVYERAVEIDDSRVFALTQAAAISSLTGNTDAALSLLDKALSVEPKNPAVLLCLCQTHSQLASHYKSLGALTLASGSLQKAAESAAMSARINGTLEATWKSLGDCRVAQAQLPTASQPPLQKLLDAGSPAEASENAAALIAAYNERKDAARSAQRAYAAAVHLNPLRPASWSDLALTQHQRVTLSAAHSAVCDTRDETAVLRSTAERVLTAALRLAPDVPGLWSALGSVETSAGKREYALRRALQLDSTDALTWLKLGRLYHAHNIVYKARECFDAARSSDPKLAAVWEAMAATEATRAPYATPDTPEATEAFGLSKHALQLRGGPEAALGFLWSALRDSEVSTWGTTRAAAHCAAAAQPLNPGAYHALGLVMEASGAFQKAVSVLRTALVLLSDSGDSAEQQGDDLGALFKVGGSSKGGLIAPCEGMSVQRCLQLDLARVLAKSGNFEEAVVFYKNVLEDSSAACIAGQDAYTLLAYARAAAGASACSDSMFDPSMHAKASAAARTSEEIADVAAAPVAALASSQHASFSDVYAHAMHAEEVMSQLGKGAEADPLVTQAAVHRATMHVHLGVLTAATFRGTDAEFAEAEATARHALLRMRMHVARGEDLPAGVSTMHAEAVADTHVAHAARSMRATEKWLPNRSSRLAAARAVHVCPWSTVHRDIAACIAASDACVPQHASRIAARRTAGPPQQLESTLMHGGATAVAHLVGNTAGLPHVGALSVASGGSLAAAVKCAKVRVVQCPQDVHAWAALAHLLTQQAVLSHRSKDATSAEWACMQALHIVRASSTTTTSPDKRRIVGSSALAVHTLVLQSIAQSMVAVAEESKEPQIRSSSDGVAAPHLSRAMHDRNSSSSPSDIPDSRLGPGGPPQSPTSIVSMHMHFNSTNSAYKTPVVTAQERIARALCSAQKALEEIAALAGGGASALSDGARAVKCACLRQIARCQRIAGDSAAAEAALMHGKQLGDASCSILLAKHLLASGRSAEGAVLLSEASGTFRESAAGSHACAEWLGSIDVAQVEIACMSSDLEVARSVLDSAAATGGRAASVARALVATAVCAHVCEFVKIEGLTSEVKQRLSEVRKHALQALEKCDGADVATVSASAIAQSERLRGKPDVAGVLQDVVDCGYRELVQGTRRKGACMQVERVGEDEGVSTEGAIVAPLKAPAPLASAAAGGATGSGGAMLGNDVRTATAAVGKVVVRLAGPSTAVRYLERRKARFALPPT